MKILILSAREGHASLAAAAAAALRGPGRPVRVVDAVGDNWLFHGYRFFYRFFPQLFRWPYRLGGYRWPRQIIRWLVRRQYLARWQKLIGRQRPDVILTTYWLYLPVLDSLAAAAAWRYFNLVPDPIPPSPLAYSQRAVNLGFGREFQRQGQKLGLLLSRLRPIGWLTQPRFFRRYSSVRQRQRLGLDPHRFTLLICGGSEGNQTYLRLLAHLFWHYREKDFQLIVVAGSNRTLQRLIRRSYRLAQKARRLPRLYLAGFSRKMEKLIAASDVVFGKAGPNLIFEAVAQQRPFVAISHIHGQEDGNLELIRRYRLGWVAEKFSQQRQLVTRILARPEILLPVKAAARKMAAHNRQTPIRLRQIVLD